MALLRALASPVTRPLAIGLLVLLMCGILCVAAAADEKSTSDFVTGLAGWKIKEGTWTVREGQAIADGKFSVLLRDEPYRQDFEISADVAYHHDLPHAGAGILFRFRDDFTGYAVCLREIEKGVHPQFGPWERPVVQLFRIDRDGWKVLQESKVMDCRSGLPRRIKVICQGPNLWVFYEDMETPVLKEFDDQYDRPGMIGLFKDHAGIGSFDDVSIGPITSATKTPEPPLRTDWSWVRGAVYVRSNAVNSVEMWHDYWPHTAVVDRELGYAQTYGFNMVQVYLHWLAWDKHREEYLRRIDDFLTRAAAHGLKVNFILWDDCGHVEPSLTFAAPVPGRHNSQMMPNPSHKIRDSRAELLAHRDRFGDYVTSVVGRFKDDKRIVFWQLYNECLGAKEQYRTSETDANLNQLLEWTRGCVKSTGTKTPVTATGGGFYGPKYADFYTYHSYSTGNGALPNTDGGSEHLCTETLNRPDAGLAECVQQFSKKANGFVAWELMIGRDNCRYPWGNPDGSAEPTVPFHGVIYPDGHPWSVDEIKALLGEEKFAALEEKSFKVEYFEGEFATLRKTSITPGIDVELGDEPGTGSPDASAGIGKDNFSIRWTGKLTPAETGKHTFTADTDGLLRIWINDEHVVNKLDHGSRSVQGEAELTKGQGNRLSVEYVHRDGKTVSRLSWRMHSDQSRN